jgi:hypothetical protein
MVKHMKTLDKPDSPLYYKLIDKIKEEYRANPTERNMTIIMSRDELEEIVDKDNFQESFEAECQKLMNEFVNRKVKTTYEKKIC